MILQIVCLIYAITMALFVMLVGSRVNSFYSNIFKQNYFSVSYDGLHPSLTNKDIAITKKKDIEDIKEGEYIAIFSRNSETFSEVIIGEVIAVDDIAGVSYFEVESFDDQFYELVSEEDVLGVYQGRLIGMDRFLSFINTFLGYLLFVVMPFVLLLVLFVLRIKMYVSFEEGQIEVISHKREDSYYKPLKLIEDEEIEEQKIIKVNDNFDFSSIRIQYIKTGELFKTSLVVNKRDKIRIWSCGDTKNKNEVLAINDDFLYGLLVSALKLFYEKKTSVFDKQFMDIVERYYFNDFLDKEHVLKTLNNIDDKTYYKLVMNFFEIIVISNNNYLLYVNNDFNITINPQKELQYKQRMKEETYQLGSVRARYNIVY